MPREKECFQDNLERICEAFPHRELLTKKDVVKFTGLSINTVNKLFVFNHNYISKVNLARAIS